MSHTQEMLRDTDFKDEQPLNTVARIKSILAENGIETEDYWYESKVPYCYSNRISVVGTNFCVYGKGLTKEFALASGYGELIERLQLGSIGSHSEQKVGNYFVSDPHEETVPVQQLLEKNLSWYQNFSEQLEHCADIRMTPEEILSEYANEDGTITTTVFYNIIKKRKENFPAPIRSWVYTSNGCAAGNTPEEAIVQGISEVVERYHQMYIIDKGLTPPDIPEEVLCQYRAAYDIITYVRSKGYRVLLKDCSLGEKFPVVCACIIDQKSGKYHTHFGAYPIFEIALERALTESFQGASIDTIAGIEELSYDRSHLYKPDTILRELTKGVSEKHPSFFVGTPIYPYNANVGFTGTNNLTLFKECLAYFSEKQLDVLVRDSSCLGFPTYQVLIPGYSESFIFRLSKKAHDHLYAPYAMKTLRNPSAATVADMLGALKHISKINAYSTNLNRLHGFLAFSALSLNIPKAEQNKLLTASLAYISYTLGKYDHVISYINSLLALVSEPEDTDYLICLKRYLSFVAHQYEPEHIRETLEFFHRPETVCRLYGYLDSKTNPLDPFTLHCDMNCTDSCPMYDRCQQTRTIALGQLIRNKRQQLSFDAFAAQMDALSAM